MAKGTGTVYDQLREVLAKAEAESLQEGKNTDYDMDKEFELLAPAFGIVWKRLTHLRPEAKPQDFGWDVR